MSAKRIFGFFLLIAGIALVIFSIYISSQVEAGKEKISSAQSSVNSSKSLFSLNPITEQLGKGITGSAENKISAGSELVAQYEKYSNWIMFGGIGLAILGLAVVILGGKRRSE